MGSRRSTKRAQIVVADGRETKTASRPLLELVAAQPIDEPRQGGLLIGKIKSVAPDSCHAFVEYVGSRTTDGVCARSTVRVRPSDVGREVVIAFECADTGRPVIIGLIQPTAPEQIPWKADGPGDVEVDGHRLVLTADKELVIRCGRATIVLTRAGKILIRGAYLSSRSSGVNRIKGGSVQIN
jgi:hypothetical protein